MPTWRKHRGDCAWCENLVANGHRRHGRWRGGLHGEIGGMRKACDAGLELLMQGLIDTTLAPSTLPTLKRALEAAAARKRHRLASRRACRGDEVACMNHSIMAASSNPAALTPQQPKYRCNGRGNYKREADLGHTYAMCELHNRPRRPWWRRWRSWRRKGEWRRGR